ncbi:hypothetical protein JQ604_04260 [Bradyrhizobium jicamae]|uniref:hypothetical protein n=1 Tax=Bradyrhizobium jicamae TaxID=280332 RepID=UPI001BAB256D|nr:hypothetical protein [Bradyrhizobium jicamae]MBR0751389.1 hypothetical protein [Bradyrhizobium jicamae]
MKAKLAIAAVSVASVTLLGYAYVHSCPPFTSQFVQTCDRAVKQRLAVPSSYQRTGLEESRREITFDEFFADPLRAVSEAAQKAMIGIARVPPVQYVAVIDYEAQESKGASIRERAACTFNSLDGTDAPTRTYWVKIDGEYNLVWAARERKDAMFDRRWRELE